MYRSLMIFIPLVFFNTIALAQMTCSEGPQELNNQCLINKENNFYIFTDEFNGRKIAGEAPNFTTLSSEVTLSKGYYQDQNILWSNETKLDGSFIKKGVTLFGIEGQLDNDMNYSDCNLNDADSPPYSNHKNNSCFVNADNFYYSQPFGGRSIECIFDSVNSNKIINSPCWIVQSKVNSKVVRSSESYINCPFGRVTSLCTHKKAQTPKGFLYNFAYNGRTQLCCSGNSGNCSVSSACLISSVQIPAQISTGTQCKENGILNTVNGVSFYGAPNSDAQNDSNCITKTDVVNNKTGRYVYSFPFGGRTNCNDNGAGMCWFYSTNKVNLFAGLEINPNTNKLKNIAVGTSVFGIQGEYVAAQISYGSGSHRTKTSGSTNQIFYDTESTLTNSLEIAKPQYHPIPKITIDSDGYNKSTQVTPFSRSNLSFGIGQCSIPTFYTKVNCEANSGLWTSECGNVSSSDSLQIRIDDCASKIGTCSNSSYNSKSLCESHGGSWTTKSFWNGSSLGNSGEGRWDMVSRVKTGSVYYEVWQDNSTKLLWSSLIHKGINWCKASGSNNSIAVSNTFLKSPDPSNLCDNNIYQINSSPTELPVSLCFEDSLSFQKTTSNSIGGKAGLGLTENSTDFKVLWRLPTLYDYLMANHNGIRFVLPDMDSEEWTATISASDFSKAWIFDSTTGTFQRRLRKSSMGVRCVGR